ncbi:MAG: Flp family type IVb pilin [Kiritimatiellia bacterium]|jgi:Flp pilus assembly pilin Flp
MSKKPRNRRSGQTMVEYIIIVVLIAITGIVLFGKFGKAIFKKTAGATSALDADVGSEAQGAYEDVSDGEGLRSLQEDGTLN